MDTVNYGDAGSKTADKGVFTLTLEAIAASQMQRAERESVQHEHAVTRDLTRERDNENEPFGGW
jgi:hypothetical protein